MTFDPEAAKKLIVEALRAPTEIHLAPMEGIFKCDPARMDLASDIEAGRILLVPNGPAGNEYIRLTEENAALMAELDDAQRQAETPADEGA